MNWINEPTNNHKNIDDSSNITPYDGCIFHACFERSSDNTGPCGIRLCIGTIFCYIDN